MDVSAARGWAAGLVLLADRAAAGDLRAEVPRPSDSRSRRTAVFAALTRQLLDALTAEEQEAMLKVSLLPEITPDLAKDLTGSEAARNIARTPASAAAARHSRRERARSVYHLHDLLRDFLQNLLAQHFAPRELANLREQAATLLARRRISRCGDRARSASTVVVARAAVHRRNAPKR